jgi:D-erythrulose 1-phosphate 3-epimerase
MPDLHLGINTCFAVKRWPEPEQWLTIVKEELGLNCCQFSLDLVDPLLDESATTAYANTVRAYAGAHDILLHSTFTGLAAYSWSQLLHPVEAMREAAMQWYERAINFTARLGALGTGGHIGALSVQDAMNEDRKRELISEMRERLASLSRYAAEKGLQFLLFENMAVSREWGHSIEEAQSLANLVAQGGVPLVLCLDVGHPCALHTGTVSDYYLAWFAQSWPHTPVVHLQQTDRTGDHHWPFTQAYNDQGIVRADSVLNTVRHWPDESDVYLFLEPIHAFEADDDVVLHDLRQSVQYWREAMQR